MFVFLLYFSWGLFIYVLSGWLLSNPTEVGRNWKCLTTGKIKQFLKKKQKKATSSHFKKWTFLSGALVYIRHTFHQAELLLSFQHKISCFCNMNYQPSTSVLVKIRTLEYIYLQEKKLNLAVHFLNFKIARWSSFDIILWKETYISCISKFLIFLECKHIKILNSVYPFFLFFMSPHKYWHCITNSMHNWTTHHAREVEQRVK